MKVRLVFLILVSLVAVIAAYGAGRFLAEARADPCPGEQGETSACWDAYYEGVLERRGFQVALADLERRYNEGGGAKTFCHPILHKIGAAAGDEYGSVAEAYEHARTFCRAGFYHGVLEGIFGEDNGERLLRQLNDICAAIPGKERYSYNYYSCVHGIGHGLMAFFEHNVFQSLSGCDTLVGEWEKGSCYGGVFMENVISDTPEMPSKYLSTEDPLYPCTAVQDRHKYQCYQMQTSHMLEIFAGDFSRAFATCRGVEEKYRASCFQSIGRDASGWSYGDGEKARALCSNGATLPEREQCLVGTAVDYIQSVNPAGARAFCENVEEGARDACRKAIEWQIGAL